MRAEIGIVLACLILGFVTYCTFEGPKADACGKAGYEWVPADSSCWTLDGRRAFPWKGRP